MAQMYPAEISPETESNAERRIFARIRDETPGAWVALHSLGLKGHSRKLWAEADFVLITPAGVYVLEVKGGAIARNGRRWLQNGHEMRQSPFDQGGGAAGALRRDLHEHVAATRRSCIAHGVVFPDVVFEADGPDIEREIVYDARDLANPFETYVQRVTDFWHARLARRPVELTPGERSSVVHRLAGDFDLVRSLRSVIDETRSDLVRLTEQQKTAIEGLEDNRRVIVQGGAGTGKTVLAIHEAERLAARGKRVLLCCHSRRLASKLRDSFGHAPTITIDHYFGLLASLIADAAMRDQLPDASERDLFDVFYPAVAMDALEALSPGEAMFDALVLDEAQDIMLTTHLEVFDRLVDGGVEHGDWRVFVDPNQDVFAGAGADARRRLLDQGTTFKLSVNCRNTFPIAMQAALLGGSRIQPTLAAEGPDVTLTFVRDGRERSRELSRVLRGWIEGGISADQITILSPRSMEKSSLRDGLPKGVPAVVWHASGDPVERPVNAVEFSTIAAFKGLEATAVVVVDVDHLEADWDRINGYVASSRATSLLAMLLSAELEPEYRELARELGERDGTADRANGR